MDEKPNLVLLNSPREFGWTQRCCSAKDPEKSGPCPDAVPGTAKNSPEPKCPWWIASEEHEFSFWRYVKDKSDPTGVMKELVQSELAALFCWSNTKTHFMLKQAVTELTDALKIHGAIELLEDLDSDSLESMMVVSDFDEFKSDDRE